MAYMNSVHSNADDSNISINQKKHANISYNFPYAFLWRLDNS